MRRKTNVKRRPWGDMQKHCGRQMTSMGRCAKKLWTSNDVYGAEWVKMYSTENVNVVSIETS